MVGEGRGDWRVGGGGGKVWGRHERAGHEETPFRADVGVSYRGT